MNLSPIIHKGDRKSNDEGERHEDKQQTRRWSSVCYHMRNHTTHTNTGATWTHADGVNALKEAQPGAEWIHGVYWSTVYTLQCPHCVNMHTHKNASRCTQTQTHALITHHRTPVRAARHINNVRRCKQASCWRLPLCAVELYVFWGRRSSEYNLATLSFFSFQN